MDWLLIILGIILLIVGFAGAVLPVLPGPPMSFVGLLVLHFSSKVQFTTAFLLIAALVALVITILDYVIPTYFTQKMKASKAATNGTMIGTFLGLLIFPPLGILILPIVGAFLGEFIFSKSIQMALKSAFASLAGLVGGIVLKGVYGLWALIYGIYMLF